MNGDYGLQERQINGIDMFEIPMYIAHAYIIFM